MFTSILYHGFGIRGYRGATNLGRLCDGDHSIIIWNTAAGKQFTR
jgi:hypothetical protein